MTAQNNDIFRCPHCAPTGAGALSSIKDNWLGCADCGRNYPVVQDIPVLLPAEGDKWQNVSPDALPTIEAHDRFVSGD